MENREMSKSAMRTLGLLLLGALVVSVIFIYFDQTSISPETVRRVFRQYMVSMSEDENVTYEIDSMDQVFTSEVIGGDVWCVVTEAPIQIVTAGGDFQPVSHFVVNKQFQSWYVRIYEDGERGSWQEVGCGDW